MLLDACLEFLDPGKKREKKIDRDYRVMVLPVSFLTMAFSVKFSLFPAQAAGARPFSAARERMQRERKGGNHVSPLLKPLTRPLRRVD